MITHFSLHSIMTSETSEVGMQFVDLIVDSDYEIATTYPFIIRRKRDGFIPKEYVDSSNGYVRLNLNGKMYYKHRLIAQQFIPNDDPEHKNQVDHINRDRTDYHIENLHWVDPRTNSFNRSSHKGVAYEFIDDIPDEAIEINYYDTKKERRRFNQHQYYYYNDHGEDVFYSRISDDGLYRIMHINTLKNGSRFVGMKDINHKFVGVVINRFKYQYNIE